MPGAISSFRNAFPDVELRLTVQATTPLLAQLSQDVLERRLRPSDVTSAESLRAIPLPDERLWIALPADHNLATRKRLRLGDLRNEPFKS